MPGNTVVDYSAQLSMILQSCGLPAPAREYRFCERRWRFDLAYPALRLGIEVEGGGWVGGRHNRPQGYAADCEKYNRAVVLGWRVLRYTPDMLGDAPADVRRILEVTT